MTTQYRCKFCQVEIDCPFVPSRENCRECLQIEVDKANGGDGICEVCGTDRRNHLEMMRVPCWMGHGEHNQFEEGK